MTTDARIQGHASCCVFIFPPQKIQRLRQRQQQQQQRKYIFIMKWKTSQEMGEKEEDGRAWVSSENGAKKSRYNPFFRIRSPTHRAKQTKKYIYIITIITNERCWSGSRGRQHGQIAIFPAPTHFSASIYFVSSCRRKMQTSNEEVIESQQAIRKKRKEKKKKRPERQFSGRRYWRWRRDPSVSHITRSNEETARDNKEKAQPKSPLADGQHATAVYLFLCIYTSRRENGGCHRVKNLRPFQAQRQTAEEKKKTHSLCALRAVCISSRTFGQASGQTKEEKILG